MTINARITNKLKDPRVYTWIDENGMYFEPGQTHEVDISRLPSHFEGHISKRLDMRACLNAGEVTIKIVTDLPIIKLAKKSNPKPEKVKASEKAPVETLKEETPKVDLPKEQGTVTQEEITNKSVTLDNDRFVQGATDDFKNNAFKLDGDDQVIQEPLTVEIFANAPKGPMDGPMGENVFSAVPEMVMADTPAKEAPKPRGRPKGSKNKPKEN